MKCSIFNYYFTRLVHLYINSSFHYGQVYGKYAKNIQLFALYITNLLEWQIEEGGISFLGGEYDKGLGETTIHNFHEMMQQGVLIYKEEQLCMPREIINLVRERENYMADYVINDAGRLCEIHFDKLSR